ncbi:hypothetical protein D3C76_1221870 [compost metagenome]
MRLDDFGDGFQRVEDAGAGLAVDQRDVGDFRIGLQQALDVGGGGRHVFFGFKGAELAADDLADLRQALAVGAVDQHQDLAITRHQGTDRGFHGEGAAALQRYAGVGFLATDDVQQAAAHAGSQLVEIVVPGAPVHQHRPAGAVGSGQRTGGQQDGSALGNGHSRFLIHDRRRLVMAGGCCEPGFNFRGRAWDITCQSPIHRSNCLS